MWFIYGSATVEREKPVQSYGIIANPPTSGPLMVDN